MKKPEPVKVVNINRNGEVFDPHQYVVTREASPEVYKYLGGYKTCSN